MAAVGAACLIVALLTASYSAVAALYGARTGRRQFVVSARRAMYAMAGVLLLAMALLEVAFVRSDFSFSLVQRYSSTDTPLFYKLTAMWSSQEGSLLLWATLLSVYSSVVLYVTRHRHRQIAPYANAVLAAIAVFFLGLIVIGDENAFATVAHPAAQGQGLNPLLRHPAMMFHPPALYSGYVGFAIPFAFMVGALITRRTNADWIRSTRRFALIAWTFLGTGVLLGALWSYTELGWGGYWAWDPVENAALMPWLTATAFLLLNNLVLVALCVVIAWGTYFPLISEAITGTKESVGPPFFNRITTPLALLLVLLSGIGPMLAWRRGTVAGAARVFGFPIACAGAALATMLLLTPAAESVTSLIMFTFVAFVLAAIGQEFWRGARARRLMSGETVPTALYQLVVRNRRRYGGYLVHAGFATLLLGVAASSAFADQRDVRLTPGQSATVGGYHMTYVKPTAAFLDDKAGTGAPITLGAVVAVRKGDQRFTFRPGRNYYPTQDPSAGVVGRFFNGDSNSEVSVKWGPLGNFWTAAQPDIGVIQKPIAYANRHFANVSSPDVLALIVAGTLRRYLISRPAITFTAIHSPMIMWIWVGGLIAIIGSLTALWPSPEARRRRASSLAAARLGRELSRA